MLPSFRNRLVAHTVKQINNQHPKKTSFKLFNGKPQTQETEENAYSVITTTKSTDRPRPTGHSPLLYPTIGNPISPHQSRKQMHQTQAQQKQQITAQTLLPYSCFLPNTTLPPPTLKPAPPQARQPELFNYSNTPKFSTQPKNFANTIRQLALNCHSQFILSEIFTTPHMVLAYFLTLLILIQYVLNFFHLLHQKLQIILLIRHKGK